MNPYLGDCTMLRGSSETVSLIPKQRSDLDANMTRWQNLPQETRWHMFRTPGRVVESVRNQPEISSSLMTVQTQGHCIGFHMFILVFSYSRELAAVLDCSIGSSILVSRVASHVIDSMIRNC